MRHALEVVPKLQLRFDSKPATITADKAQADEKAQSASALWRMSVHFEEVCDAP